LVVSIPKPTKGGSRLGGEKTAKGLMKILTADFNSSGRPGRTASGEPDDST